MRLTWTLYLFITPVELSARVRISIGSCFCTKKAAGAFLRLLLQGD